MSSDNKQIALVTGGNRGLGNELAKQLALKGFKVILASRNLEMGKKAAEKLKELNLDVSSVEMDVTNQESIHQAAATINVHFGRLDVLINNAGVYLDKNEKLLAMDPIILENTMATNFFGVYDVIRSFIPLMEKQGYGRIINISSEYGANSELSYPGVGAYKLSKFALNGLTQLVAAEVNGDIKINAVDPGWVRTDMGGQSAPKTPREAAESIIWLATIGREGPSGAFFRDGKQIPW
ncbi:SDR family NAD(P)-dependent oxidoreductase [Metabacillus niabensis]|uniref:NAD(P)-dependent dehydrogenase (Short-subunit alcohol dehydrogenase family) n=1 Tax=Metabacillus niabensis TaxID=324854 RepID=A0ABT9Z1Y4_9BACI|nr:SDR family NAD(P)-dependent oxidoreductase [Metabacillus niabensis]MDQ0226217.1 NAD(P)-dependent dehydrogenase (short-subunit alcohol dehydrogenase family) [Metabacillus niabensis]